MAENNKKKRRTYHIMLFVDRRDGGVNQIGIDRRLVQICFLVFACVMIISIVGWSVSSGSSRMYREQNELLKQDITAMSTELSELTTANNELNNKVTILSDTVNTKVEEQNAIQQESEAIHTPDGFPLSSSASMSSDDEDPLTVIFTSNQGTSVIATGAGKVTEVIPDTEYGNCIKIDHGNGYVTEYRLASAPLIREGDEVLQGAILSLVESDKSKLAYRVYLDGKQINPMDIIKIDG